MDSPVAFLFLRAPEASGVLEFPAVTITVKRQYRLHASFNERAASAHETL
ncbi:MAG: hypothetical protein WB523_22410 [Candidatus Sulfotelmatobacter sp.]